MYNYFILILQNSTYFINTVKKNNVRNTVLSQITYNFMLVMILLQTFFIIYVCNGVSPI